MKSRFAVVGYGLAVIGLAFLVAGGVAYFRVQDGYDSLQAFSEAQDVELPLAGVLATAMSTC